MNKLFASNDFPSYRQATRCILGWSVEDRLDEIRCPTLIVAAEHDYTSVETKQAYAKKIQNAQVAIIPNSRHMTPLDQPHLLNKVMNDFFNKTA